VRRGAASGSSGSSLHEKLVTDKGQYIAFLEQQLERVSTACQNIQFLDEKLNDLKETQNTYEAKITNLAKLVKLDKQHTSKIAAETSEYTDNLKKRIQFLEQQSKEKFDQINQTLQRVEQVYNAFPADAQALTTTGAVQPQGLPGFIAAYIHSLFASHTQQTAASLTQQSQTQQVHLQNWVQEYIKTTHPATPLAEEVATLKKQLATLNSKTEQSEAHMLSLIDKRLGGYTEVYTSMEDRFLSVIDVHQKRVTESIQANDQRMQELQAQLTTLNEKVSSQQTKVEQLSSDVTSTQSVSSTFLPALDELQVKLDSGIVDFNANLNHLVLELREKTWHAEQTCSRLAVDTLARQNTFQQKMEANLNAKAQTLTTNLEQHVRACNQATKEITQNLQACEARVEKANKKVEQKNPNTRQHTQR